MLQLMLLVCDLNVTAQNFCWQKLTTTNETKQKQRGSQQIRSCKKLVTHATKITC